ncbi:MAG: prepilin-type N-terminal cleavage/methylation domain-containing protein [bacterium]
MQFTKGNSAGFTLIELLIVVAIIGILAAIAVPNFLNAQTRAKIARVYSDLKAQSTAMDQYYLDWNNYPPGNRPAPRLVPLTTPVAYLTSCPRDPFNSIKAKELFDGVDPYYHYASDTDQFEWLPHNWACFTSDTFSWTSCEGRIPFPGWIKYMHRSLGPDCEMNHAFAYEISNGLHSLGDIVHWGPGPVTDHHAYQQRNK